MTASILSEAEQSLLEDRVDDQITAARLRPADHPFFAAAKRVAHVEPADALAIAVQFREMTKAFMFTTIAGLGTVARSFAKHPSPHRDVLAVFQTAYRVIGDDLDNIGPVFCTMGPKGPAGMHYVWWDESIVEPIAAHVDDDARSRATVLPPPLLDLLTNMDRLATHPLGSAVQLRVVEAIARDVAIAFRRMLPKVRAGETAIFTSSKDLVWVDAHIRAEALHARQVSDHETGMVAVVTSGVEADEFVSLVDEYATNWSRCLAVYVEHLGG